MQRAAPLDYLLPCPILDPALACALRIAVLCLQVPLSCSRVKGLVSDGGRHSFLSTMLPCSPCSQPINPHCT